MSGKGSEGDRFVEHSHRETRMDFDDGGVPFYVAIVWVVFLLSYIIYMVRFAFPDWSAWGQL